MPKLPGSVEDWQAPWETATGETEIDKDKLKRYLFNLLGDKEKLQERLTETSTERDTLKTAAEAAARQGETTEQRLERELKELKATVDGTAKGEDGGDLAKENLRLKVAIEKGLNKAQLKRLMGDTEEEMLADADELLSSFGSHGDSTEGEGGLEDGGLRRVPKGRTNPGDPNPGAAADIDVNKALEQIPRIR